jgi:hypothetical protein
MHFPAKQTVALALALLSAASSVKAEEGFPHKRDDTNIEVARIHAREFAPVLYKPALAVRTEGAKRANTILHEDHDEDHDDDLIDEDAKRVKMLHEGHDELIDEV